MPADPGLSERSLRPYSTTEKYLLAVREDLAEWLATLYPDSGIDTSSFFSKLETGVLLCHHINALIDRLKTASACLPAAYGPNLVRPATRYAIHCRQDVQPGTFQARDNICSCLRWLRAMQLKECLLFETDDLVLRKNEKSVVLCLLEVARIGARLGMAVPTLIEFEREIDADEQRQSGSVASGSYSSDDIDEVASSLSNESTSSGDGSSRLAISTGSLISPSSSSGLLPVSQKNVDQVVKEQARECRCQTTFPLIRVAPGKYRVGPSRLVIYVRILRNHVMVRVGGGWDTLDHFLEKHDPCRRRGCCNEPPRSSAPSSTSTVVGTAKSQPPPQPTTVLKQKTDLTPLQVVFNRDCPAMLPSVAEPATVAPSGPLSSRSSLTAAAGTVDHTVTRRRISQPLSKVDSKRPSQSVPAPVRALRARSMDVGLLLDQFNPTKKTPTVSVLPSHLKVRPVKEKPKEIVGDVKAESAGRPATQRRVSLMPTESNPSKEVVSRRAPVTMYKKPDSQPQRKRYSLMELEEIPSSRREKAVIAAATTDVDHWDTAFNRHRQNFLRIKDIFGTKSESQNSFRGEENEGRNVNKGRVDTDKGHFGTGRNLGSPSSPDSASEEGSLPSKDKKEAVQTINDVKSRQSVEDGFFSDASCKSE